MKKFFFLAACGLLTLAGCSKDVTPVKENVNLDQMPVGFGVYSNTAATRATSLDAAGVQASGIGVFAFEQEQANLAVYSKANYMPNFMFNQQVTFTSPNWVYSPIKYWPNNPGAKVSFFAYAPYTADFSNDSYIHTPETNSYLNEVVPNADGLRLILGYDHSGPGIEYNMPSDPTKGVDLLWGAKQGADKCPYDMTKPGITDKIHFQMKHALSRLAFTIQVVTDKVDVLSDGTDNNELAANTTIKIKRVSLVGNFASKGTLRLYDGSWNVTNGDNQTLEFVEDANQFAAVIDDGITGAEAKAAIPLLNSVVAGDNYVMAIPGARFYIEIEYDVITEDPADAKNNSTVTNVISSLTAGGGTVTPPIAGDGKFLLEAGTAYMFNLKLGMTSVKFDVIADDWASPVTEYQVDLPKNLPALTGLTMSQATAAIAVGANVTLSVTPTPAEAVPSVIWTSSDTAVATVDATGKVTGVAAGTATITATSTEDPLIKATCTVTVS